MRNTLYSPLNQRLAETFRKARLAKAMTQGELAKATGRSQAYISKLENGQMRMDVADLLLFSRCLSVDVHQLIDDLQRE